MAKSWLSSGGSSFSAFKKATHDESRRSMRDMAERIRVARSDERESMSTPGDREKWLGQIRSARENLQHIDAHSRGMSPEEVVAEKAKHHAAVQEAEKKLAKMPAAQQHGVQEGARGGRYYVSSTGQKVYVKDNPGAEVVGHMRNQRFVQGLPMSVHLAEPKKSR